MKDFEEGQLLRRRRTRYATITDYAYPARLKMPTHFHEPAQISMVLTGGFEESIGGDHLDCGSNKVLFRPAAREHAVRFGNTRTRILNLQLSTTVTDYAKQAKVPLDKVADLSGTRSSWLIARIHDEFLRKDPTSNLALDALILDMLVELGRLEESSHWQQKLGSVEEYIRANLDGKLTLEDLAQQAKMHPVSLSRAFRKMFGCTIGSYIRRIRLERATTLLTTTDLSIATIAKQLGFADQAHFARVFKAETGFTPRLCQRAHSEC